MLDSGTIPVVENDPDVRILATRVRGSDYKRHRYCVHGASAHRSVGGRADASSCASRLASRIVFAMPLGLQGQVNDQQRVREALGRTPHDA